MLVTTLIALFAAQALCAAVYDRRGSRVTREREQTPVEHFPWDAFEQNTGVNWKDYIRTPGDGVPQKFTCTRNAGTNPQDCAAAFSAWDSQDDGDGSIQITGGQCVSIVKGKCEATVCAPVDDLDIETREITGRFWNPLQIKCIMGGTGGIFQSVDSDFVMAVGRVKE